MQIGDENVLRAGLLLDEVFGATNRVALIPYVTSGSSSAKTLPSVCDFLLWYAKDKSQVKYRQLYEPLSRAEKAANMSFHAMVELPDGSTDSPSPEQLTDPDGKLPPGARFYQRMPLNSPGISKSGRSQPYYWNGQEWPCPAGEQWRVSMEGMERLDNLGRLDAAGPGSILRWKRYEDEIPGRQIHNLWRRKASASDKRYVVQTADSVIERCVLMATDPGDLVFDPTAAGPRRRWLLRSGDGVGLLAIRRQSLSPLRANDSPQRPSPTGRWLTQPTAHAKRQNSQASLLPLRPPMDGATTPPKASSTNESLRCRQVSWRMTRTPTPYCL